MRNEKFFNVSFSSPALLGGSSPETASLRVPPFRSQLRFFWRIAQASSSKVLDPKLLREKETKLFGGTGSTDRESQESTGSSGPGRSKVDLALFGVDRSAKPWAPTPGFTFERGEKREQAVSYLGYSRVRAVGKRDQAIKYYEDYSKALLPPDVVCNLRLSWYGDPSSPRHLSPKDLDSVFNALELMSSFGAVGNRSRHGYGSFTMSERDGDEALVVPTHEELQIRLSKCASKYCVGWTDAFVNKTAWSEMWPKGFARFDDDKDKKISVWVDSMTHRSIEDAFIRLEDIWKELRSSQGSNRYVLGSSELPDEVKAMYGGQDDGARWPSQLRAKIFRVKGDGGKERFVVVFYMIPYFGEKTFVRLWSDVFGRLKSGRDGKGFIQLPFQKAEL
jgi:hypothetical protein